MNSLLKDIKEIIEAAEQLQVVKTKLYEVRRELCELNLWIHANNTRQDGSFPSRQTSDLPGKIMDIVKLIGDE